MKANVKESDIKSLIKKAVNEGIEEYRGLASDGDYQYYRPNGKTNFGSGLDYFHTGKNGKRTKNNITVGGDQGEKESKSTTMYTPGMFDNGKGHLCWKATRAIERILYGNEKVEWTDAEKEKIKDISSALYALAILTKEEGNKKRGYDGPEEEPEEGREDEPAFALNENDIKYIISAAKKVINEGVNKSE